MDARDEALRVMGWELALEHVQTALRYGGFVVWLPEVVAILVPWMDGHADCRCDVLAVLYAGGDVRRLAELADDWLRAGYSKVLLCRGFRGDDRCRVWDMARFARLVKAMN